MQTQSNQLETLLRRDRGVIAAGLAVLTLAAWTYLVYLAAEMPGMEMTSDVVMPQVQRWGAIELLLLVVMWAAMMVAMMVPSAAPLVLMFARAYRHQAGRGVVGSANALLAGYLLAWLGFSVVAALAQWMLHGAALLSPSMAATSSILGGVLLMAVGGYQYTSFKRACLVRCRSPLSFLMSDWRPGRPPLLLGLRHGIYCVGCCWMLMALLFVAGVMNLLWVAAIAGFILVEKVALGGELVGRIVGAGLIAAGLVLMVGYLVRS